MSGSDARRRMPKGSNAMDLLKHVLVDKNSVRLELQKKISQEQTVTKSSSEQIVVVKGSNNSAPSVESVPSLPTKTNHGSIPDTGPQATKYEVGKHYLVRRGDTWREYNIHMVLQNIFI